MSEVTRYVVVYISVFRKQQPKYTFFIQAVSCSTRVVGKYSHTHAQTNIVPSMASIENTYFILNYRRVLILFFHSISETPKPTWISQHLPLTQAPSFGNNMWPIYVYTYLNSSNSRTKRRKEESKERKKKKKKKKKSERERKRERKVFFSVIFFSFFTRSRKKIVSIEGRPLQIQTLTTGAQTIIL